MTNLNIKQSQFNAAMERYHSNTLYSFTGKLVATLNVTLQIALLYFMWGIHLSLTGHLLALLVAFVLTDFVNGLIHMIMDHKEDYDAFYGPLVANFHLHHQTPKYTKRPLPVVYFNETGAKVWLVPFLALVLFFVVNASLAPWILYLLVYVGILSSVAEVSHYLCHTSKSKTAEFLARAGILLSKSHHARHHAADNLNYAFLNGMSDPLINLIARTYFKGYKSTTDLHFAYYAGGVAAEQR